MKSDSMMDDSFEGRLSEWDELKDESHNEVEDLEEFRRSGQPVVTVALARSTTKPLTVESFGAGLSLVVQCQICKMETTVLKEMLEHLKSAHNILHSLQDLMASNTKLGYESDAPGIYENTV